jgi:hypothetical protein
MKKFFSVAIFSLLSLSVSAKKVKFAVDMTSYTISPNGIHVMGDFQVTAGFGTMDWDPGSTLLTQEGTTNIYSIVVNLPAFQKYEFKFVNGDQGYEAEFVPDEARVGYNFNDNRWIYVDSLSNDTSFLGAVQFSNNSPIGKTLIRYMVDMSVVGPISPNGVHVGTSYQSSPYDPSKIRMYSFGNGVYEIINYVTVSSPNYIYYNGNTAANVESVPSPCAFSGKRGTTLLGDSILNTVCFHSCNACLSAGANELASTVNSFDVYPNPANQNFYIRSNSTNESQLSIYDNTGKLVKQQAVSAEDISVSVSEFNSGIYFLKLQSADGLTKTKKLLVHR